MNSSKNKSKKQGVYSILSPLEADVLKMLWEKDSQTVRQIYLTLKKKRKVALTSVAVILDRLHKKKLVSREVETGLGGTHYIYSTKTTEKDFEKSVVEKAVNKLIDS
ncbi:MAG: BlaI/MecI/CopY family transcriptional regulator, partial [Candidatus Diapherotrites archaeon]|nr:BlaI/MecI/CopY family transcriptional regulator [Candidatus Diapherotrites archaeon]